MPNIKSAKKRVKTDAKKRVSNREDMSSMRTAIKKTQKDIKNNDVNQATNNLKEAVKRIDKALKAGIIKKNKAARDKSKLMKAVNKIK